MISIFAKKSFRHPDGHQMRVTSIIRGWQIAEYLGAKLNPTEDFKNDVCIYVKPHVKPGQDFKFEGKAYLDVIDGTQLLHLAEKHPEVTVISCSLPDTELFSSKVSNKIVTIPQHHCNFERVKRNRKKVTTLGFIGSSDLFRLVPEDLRQGLQERGINFIEYSNFHSREDVINFYKNIDIQLVWRPYRCITRTPLKLINGASFGIPTIAHEDYFWEDMANSYFKVEGVKEFFVKLDKLIQDSNLYSQISDACYREAEKYHIKNISKLYQKLN